MEENIGFSESDMFSTPINGEDPLLSCSMDSIFDEILKDTHHHVCTHTHTCNPPAPGPDLSHTHTCFHVHTKILSAPADRSAESAEKSSCPKKRLRGNRDAVKKYREKKKAHAASLEEEAAKLRALNQQLMNRLQGEAALVAEAARLRCLLVDIRGRIEGEIGSFPYQKPMRRGGELVSMHFVSPCDFCCDDQAYCGYPGMRLKNIEGSDVTMDGRGSGVCDVGSGRCRGSPSSGSKNLRKEKVSIDGLSAADDKLISLLASSPEDIRRTSTVFHLSLSLFI
ncbi:hypothetical protein ACMD2_20033 [Ananas comosus]|uniref:BZIP domain-containing protein n=1 Tax=Ananas comosus TaxID=4615 RepID=A0A199VJH0_ANACO|nr:hypothetical protein ACMD2_20033 [Ananas comosus]